MQDEIERFLIDCQKRPLNCFGFALLSYEIKNLTPPSQPIRYKTKTNRDLVTRVFPRLASVTHIFFEFSLVRFVVYVFCDWPLFRFHDTRLLKTALKFDRETNTSPSRFPISAVIAANNELFPEPTFPITPISWPWNNKY